MSYGTHHHHSSRHDAPGRVAVARGLVYGIQCAKTQLQPCGIDLSLRLARSVDSWSCGHIDFDNTHRQTAATSLLPFNAASQSLHLRPGAYLIEFNERVSVPLDAMGQLFVRSSLFRSGAAMRGGLVDSGYESVLGAMLAVHSPSGIVLHRDVRLAQLVFYTMTEAAEAYRGRYQCANRM